MKRPTYNNVKDLFFFGHETKVCKLIKQTPKQEHEKFDKANVSLKLMNVTNVYMSKVMRIMMTMMWLYVDNMLSIGQHLNIIAAAATILHKC